MEHFGIRISRESELRRKEKMKAYGKFGMADIGVAGAETLDDVGNYDDVKDELKESLQRMKEYYEEGLIDEEEYKQKKEEILKKLK